MSLCWRSTIGFPGTLWGPLIGIRLSDTTLSWPEAQISNSERDRRLEKARERDDGEAAFILGRPKEVDNEVRRPYRRAVLLENIRELN